MYLDTILRKVELDQADYIFMGIFIGYFLGLYLKKRRKKSVHEKVG
jgi:hypothetical protein